MFKPLVVALLSLSLVSAPAFAQSGFSKKSSSANSSSSTAAKPKNSAPAYKPSNTSSESRYSSGSASKPASSNYSRETVTRSESRDSGSRSGWSTPSRSSTSSDIGRKATAVAGATALGAVLYQSTKSAEAAAVYEANQPKPQPPKSAPETPQPTDIAKASAPKERSFDEVREEQASRRARELAAMERSALEQERLRREQAQAEQRRAIAAQEREYERRALAYRESQLAEQRARDAKRARDAALATMAASTLSTAAAGTTPAAPAAVPPAPTLSTPVTPAVQPSVAPSSVPSMAPKPVDLHEETSIGEYVVGLALVLGAIGLLFYLFVFKPRTRKPGSRRTPGQAQPLTKKVHYTL